MKVNCQPTIIHEVGTMCIFMNLDKTLRKISKFTRNHYLFLFDENVANEVNNVKDKNAKNIFAGVMCNDHTKSLNVGDHNKKNFICFERLH